jgi:hypothetical protein
MTHSASQPERSRQTRILVRISLILALITLFAMFFPVATREHYPCAVCQLQRREVSIAGIVAVVNNAETECSRWYQEHVTPHHTHHWVRGTWSESLNVFGATVSGSNLSERAGGPIVRFSSHDVKLMYESCPDSEKVRTALLKLATWAGESSVERAEQVETERKLARWVESGCVEPWPLDDVRQQPAAH